MPIWKATNRLVPAQWRCSGRRAIGIIASGARGPPASNGAVAKYMGGQTNRLAMRLLASLAISLMLLAGCMGTPPSDPPGSGKPETVQTVVQGNPSSPPGAPILLSNRMDLHFVSPSSAVRVRLEPAAIMDGYGQTVQGIVLSMGDERSWTWHFGFDACMTPIWAMLADQDVFFAAAQDGQYFRTIPGFLLLRAAPLSFDSRKEVPVSDDSKFPLPGTEFLLAAHQNGDETVTRWVWRDPQPESPDREFGVQGVWYQSGTAAGIVPGWIRTQQNEEPLRLFGNESTSTGTPLERCGAFSELPGHVARQALTARATPHDPPLGWSLADMLRTSRSDASLTTLHEWETLPSTAIYEWSGAPIHQVGTGDVLPNAFRWTTMYGRPETHQVLYVTCDRTVDPDLPAVAPLTVHCSEALDRQDELRPLPTENFANGTVESYEEAFAVYHALFGTNATAMRLTFNLVYRPGHFDSDAVTAALILGGQGSDPTLMLNPITGALQGLEAPLPSQFHHLAD